MSIKQRGAATGGEFGFVVQANKLAGTVVSAGITAAVNEPLIEVGANSLQLCQLSTGDYLIQTTANSTTLGLSATHVYRSNGDSINKRGSIGIPNIDSGTNAIMPAVASNRVVITGKTRSGQVDALTVQLRLINMEIAA